MQAVALHGQSSIRVWIEFVGVLIDHNCEFGYFRREIDDILI